MMMEEFEYCSLFWQSNEEQILIFDDVMHRKQLYHDTLICLFFIRGAGTGKTFTLKLIIQELLQLYNKYIYIDLTKTKALLMASINKSTSNLDSLII
jgi:Cdc6-like AAA superfamily ATPase